MFVRIYKYLIIFLLFFTASYHNIFAQTWIRIYGATNTDGYADWVIEDYDKGYIILGDAKNSTYGWLIKTDINGYVIWNKKIGTGKYHEGPVNMERTNDNGYIISGSTSKLDIDSDPFIMKMNSCMEIQWCEILNTPNHPDYGQRVRQLPDGGFIYLCRYHSYDYRKRISLIRFDSIGNVIWNQAYQPIDTLAFDEDGFDLFVSQNGDFLITGECAHPDPGGTGGGWDHSYFVKTDSSGSVIWELPYGIQQYYYGFANNSVRDSSGFIYSVGRHEKVPYGDAPCLLKTSPDGHEVYNKDLLPNTVLGISNTINWLNDTNLVIGASWAFNEYSGPTGIFKTDTLGNVRAQKTFMTLSNTISCTAKTFDNKFISVASNVTSQGVYQVYAFKVNSDMQYDTIYNYPFTYDSLCSHPIKSDTVNPNCDIIVSVSEPDSHPEKSQLKIFPNPATNTIYVIFPEQLVEKVQTQSFFVTTVHYQWKSTTLEAYDLNNKLVFQEEIPKDQTRLELDISAWGKGMYFFRLSYNKNTVAGKKVVIE